MNPQEQDKSQTPSTSQKGDDIFVIKPEPKKPVDKKSIWVTASLTIVGIIFLIIVLIVTLIGSADNQAKDYSKLAYTQVKKMDQPLKDLEPTTILNNHSTKKALSKIYLAEQSQPSLENVLFIGQWSARYTQTEKLQTKVQQHFKNLNQYSLELDQLLAFDNGVETIRQQEPNINSTLKPGDSLSIRSVGGSYERLAKEIKQLEVPPQLKDLQNGLVGTYNNKSITYEKWAKAVEANEPGTVAVSKQQLVILDSSIPPLLTDKNYAKLFMPTFEELLKVQKDLETALLN